MSQQCVCARVRVYACVRASTSTFMSASTFTPASAFWSLFLSLWVCVYTHMYTYEFLAGITMCCSVLPRVSVCCSVFMFAVFAVWFVSSFRHSMHMQRRQGVHLICCNAVLLQCVVKGAPATSASHICGVLHCVTVCCNVLQQFTVNCLFRLCL